MKKNILLSFAACGAMLLSANEAKAQEAVVVEDIVFGEVAECTDHYYSQKKDNWFIQVGAGMEFPIVEHAPHSATRHITAAYGAGFGKWFSPYLAWRLSAQGGAYHFNASGAYRKAKFVNANIDLMWDMFNSFGNVNTKRVFSMVPFEVLTLGTSPVRLTLTLPRTRAVTKLKYGRFLYQLVCSFASVCQV